MSDLQSLHKHALKLILSLRGAVEKLETLEESGRDAPASQTTAADEQLSQLEKLATQLESLHRMQRLNEPSDGPDVWARRVEQVAEEAPAQRAALARLAQRQQRRRAEAAARSELFAGGAGAGRGVFSPVAGDAAARGSIESSKRLLEEAFQTGVGVLGGMASQRETLKSAHRRTLDVLNSTGLSASLLRVIERRQNMDKILAYGGMGLTLLLVVLLFWWFKG